MKVFISWSGDASMKLGAALKEFIPLVVPHTEIFFSPGMDKGIDWFREIRKNLDESDFGVFCLTRSNMHDPWILFEAGILASKTDSEKKIAPLAIDFQMGDLRPPLNLFNSALVTYDEIYKMVQTINKSCESVIPDENIETIFKAMWPKLESAIKDSQVLANKKPEEDKAPHVPIEAMMSEVLSSVRAIKSQMQPKPNLLYPHLTYPDATQIEPADVYKNIKSILAKPKRTRFSSPQLKWESYMKRTLSWLKTGLSVEQIYMGFPEEDHKVIAEVLEVIFKEHPELIPPPSED